MRKIYQWDFSFGDESVMFLQPNCGSADDYETREECGSLTTPAWRTVPPQAVKHIILVLY